MLKFYTFLIIMFGFFEVSAQVFLIRGNVKDEFGGLVGATVAEIDKNDRMIGGAITDIDGNYSFQITSDESKLQVSFIGYKTIEVEINKREVIDFEMQGNASEIEGVQVVAERGTNSIGGISERNRVGSFATLDMASMDGIAISDATDALQGQIAGLDIISSGTPGETGNIVIRGLSTLGDATPLIVIDGIAQDDYDDFDFASADVEDLSSLLSVPTQDIKEIRVLKDATECAIWGSRGANGVIEIDTYQGSKGKTKFTVSYKHTYTQLPKQMPMLNGDEYIMMQQEQLFNNSPFSEIPDEIAYDPDYTDFYNYSQNTDWYDEITRSGFLKEMGVKVDGGGDNTSYYISLNTTDQEGTVKNEGLEKLNARVNLRFVISKNINLTTRFAYLNSNIEGNWKYSSSKTALKLAYIKAPNMAVYEYDSEGNMGDEYFTPIDNYQGDGVEYFNPVAVVNLSQSDVASNQLTSDFVLSMRLHRFITFTETVSLTNKGSKTSVFLPIDAIGAAWNDSENNSAEESNNTYNSLTTRSLLLISPPQLGNHGIQGSLMWETYENHSESLYTSTALNISSAVTDPAANAVFESIESGESETSTLGLLARVSYNYKDKYVVSSNIRGDASSVFGADNRWGIFPSIGAKWRMKEELFMKNMLSIGRADFSFSWGRAGNIASSIDAYSRHGLYEEGGQYIYDVSIVPTQPQLDGLQWETKDEISSSLDFGLFKGNKLNVKLEYYYKKTFDVAWSDYEIPTTSGYSSLDSYNGGEIRNEGFDITASVKNVIKTKDFSLMLNFNINRNTNWFEELPENQDTEQDGSALENLTYPLKTQLGSPIGSIFGVKYLGVYSTDEDAVAKNADGTSKVDVNGDPVYMAYQNGDRFEAGDAIYDDINNDGVIDINDAVYLGDSNPKLTGGFGCSAKYKQFSLTSSFAFRIGFDVVNAIAMETECMNDEDNQSKATLYRWRKEGDDFEGMIPKASYGHEFNSLGSDRYVEDGTYLKLNSLTLNYSTNKELEEKLGINNCSISFTGRKLFTWTKYSGQNPEITTEMEDPFWIAEDEGRTTPSRTYSLLISVTF
jgi:TonB-linked SusC/RagA family outer membrane protein